MATPTAAAGLTVGVRVVRGPDWKWGNQDDGEGMISIQGMRQGCLQPGRSAPRKCLKDEVQPCKVFQSLLYVTSY